MPFTLSHPAAVLPLLRWAGGRGPLVASGLVAGAMAPDVPFFADSVVRGVYRYGDLTHRWWAVPTVDVVLAGGLVAVWDGLVGGPLVDLLPEALPRTMVGRNRRFGWFAVSAAVGAATHVGWDAFTHQGRAGVRALPVLERTLAGVPVHTVLQYGTSAVGLAHVARHAHRAAAAHPRTDPPGRRRTGPAVLAVATAAGVVHRLARRERGLIAEFCFGAGAGLAVGATAYAAGVRLLTPAARRRLRTAG